MVLNETAILTAPIIGPILRVFAILQGLIGGLFGLYLILVILRWKEYRKLTQVMKDIRHELREMNSKMPEKRIRKKKK
ncbi:hypothetical protein KY332_05250 [Candidatus Woesearchaeota archaeon]|nr:hypothetical protein [Candidatus Woesearchaeota archaeon]